MVILIIKFPVIGGYLAQAITCKIGLISSAQRKTQRETSRDWHIPKQQFRPIQNVTHRCYSNFGQLYVTRNDFARKGKLYKYTEQLNNVQYENGNLFRVSEKQTVKYEFLPSTFTVKYVFVFLICQTLKARLELKMVKERRSLDNLEHSRSY